MPHWWFSDATSRLQVSTPIAHPYIRHYTLRWTTFHGTVVPPSRTPVFRSFAKAMRTRSKGQPPVVAEADLPANLRREGTKRANKKEKVKKSPAESVKADVEDLREEGTKPGDNKEKTKAKTAPQPSAISVDAEPKKANLSEDTSEGENDKEEKEKTEAVPEPPALNRSETAKSLREEGKESESSSIGSDGIADETGDGAPAMDILATSAATRYDLMKQAEDKQKGKDDETDSEDDEENTGNKDRGRENNGAESRQRNFDSGSVNEGGKSDRNGDDEEDGEKKNDEEDGSEIEVDSEDSPKLPDFVLEKNIGQEAIEQCEKILRLMVKAQKIRLPQDVHGIRHRRIEKGFVGNFVVYGALVIWSYVMKQKGRTGAKYITEATVLPEKGSPGYKCVEMCLEAAGVTYEKSGFFGDNDGMSMHMYRNRNIGRWVMNIKGKVGRSGTWYFGEDYQVHGDKKGLYRPYKKLLEDAGVKF